MATTSSFSLSVGKLLGKSFDIYLRNLPAFCLLSVMVLAPWIVLHIVANQGPSSPGLEAVGSILQSVLGMVLTGAVTYGVVQHMRDQKVGTGQLIAVGMQSFLRVLVTGIVTGLIIGIGMLLLVVPGLIAMVILYVAIPVAVIESKGVGDAMRRSAELTRGSRWQIFFAALLVGLVYVGAVLIGTFLMATTVDDTARLPTWFELAIAILLTPFSACMGAACYVMLREGKENVDVQQIAAIFD